MYKLRDKIYSYAALKLWKTIGMGLIRFKYNELESSIFENSRNTYIVKNIFYETTVLKMFYNLLAIKSIPVNN